MPYVEIRPSSAALSAFVECYWISSPTKNAAPVRILPDGCVDLIYPMSGVSAPLLVGTMTRWSLSHLAPATDLLGIRFRPAGVYPFLSIPLHLFTDRTLELDAVGASLGQPFQHMLLDCTNWASRIQVVEAFLLQKLIRSTGLPGSVAPMVHLLTTQKGQISVEQVGIQTNLSRRQVERLFLTYVGVSPKMLARIIRFRHVKSVLKTGIDDSLMGIAFDNGYTDHAHLTKEFNEFAGLPPSAYLTRSSCRISTKGEL